MQYYKGHLFFIDDTLLFGQIDNNTCNIIKEVLKKYEETSGKVINIKKNQAFPSVQIRVIH